MAGGKIAASIIVVSVAGTLLAAPSHAEVGAPVARAQQQPVFSKAVSMSPKSDSRADGSVAISNDGSKIFSAVTRNKFRGNTVTGTAVSRVWTPGKGLSKAKSVGSAGGSDNAIVSVNGSGKKAWFAYHESSGNRGRVAVRRQVGKQLKRPKSFKVKRSDTVPWTLEQSKNGSTVLLTYVAQRTSKEYARVWQAGKGWSPEQRIDTDHAPPERFSISADGSTILIASTTQSNQVRSQLWTRASGWQAPLVLATTPSGAVVRSSLAPDGRSAIVAWSMPPTGYGQRAAIFSRTMNAGVWGPAQLLIEDASIKAVATSGGDSMFLVERTDLTQSGFSDLVQYVLSNDPVTPLLQVGPVLERLGGKQFLSTAKLAIANDGGATIAMWSAGQWSGGRKNLLLRAASWTREAGASSVTGVNLPGDNSAFDFAASSNARRYVAQDVTGGRKSGVFAVHGQTR